MICHRYKFVYMEEKLGNIAGTRQIFERWMTWEPDEQAWNSFIKMELRYGEIERARQIHKRCMSPLLAPPPRFFFLYNIPVLFFLPDVSVHPEVKSWLKYAKFEEELSETGEIPIPTQAPRFKSY